MKYLIALLCLTVFSFSASAQALTGDDIKNQFVKDWTRAKAYTMEYLNAMPADKYSFKAVDSIRSFAQQMLHLAAGNMYLISTAAGQKPDFSFFGAEKRPGAQTKDSVVYYVMQSYDLALTTLSNLDPSTLGAMVTRGKEQDTKYALFLKAFEHQTHHRGQTTIYIRLLGIRPPAEQL